MTQEWLNNLWHSLKTQQTPLGEAFSREDPDGIQYISYKDRLWQRANDAEEWEEVPPLTGHL